MQVTGARAAPPPSDGPERTLGGLIAPILDETCHGASRVAVALSGGADSMALALLAQDWATQRGATLTTLTVDHGLRAESAQEAQRVAAWMRARGIAHRVLTPPPLPEIRNPQAQARARRYMALLAECRALGITRLLLAHHADDQAETVALQSHRGDTPPSRAGMALASVRDGVRLVRPLLGVRKRALVSYLDAVGQAWVEDPSNRSDASARNRLRKNLSEEEMHALWHEAQRQGEARHRDETQRNAWFAAHARSDGDGVALTIGAWRALADEARTDALSHAIRTIGGKEHRPRHHETARLDARLRGEPEGVATLGHCRIAWGKEHLRIAPEAPQVSGVDGAAAAPHMLRTDPAKLLVSQPFWWFNHPLSRGR